MWAQYKLHQRNHWIFDMDGTLTISAHDFEYMRRELGLPSNTPILEALNAMPDDQAAPLWESLNQMEYHFASQASIMHGALGLLERLYQRNVQLAILTRNTLPVVEQTLQACGIEHFFPREHIFDRDACAPKPAPDGINQLLRLWQAHPDDTVMVGDYLFDLQAGKEAGVTTIHLDASGEFPWPDVADICIRHLDEIEVLLASSLQKIPIIN
jgi:HAD superfamily hydrolase (TIGR01509 family)